MLDISKRRQKLMKELMGEPAPRLWDPPLTHYLPDIEVDQYRMACHWEFMAPHVDAFLVPGSTGDAWEMNDSEVRHIVDLSIELAVEKNISLLLGVLKGDDLAIREAITELLSTLKLKTDKDDPIDAMKASNVYGFVICPPCGSEMTQDMIEADLDSVIDLGLPIALYQLPEVTDYERSPSLVQRLADRLTQVVEHVFTLVNDIPDGNAFANANKAMDHYMAFGAKARRAQPPRLHAGTLIPEDLIMRVGEVLESAHLIPNEGYLID